MINFFDGLKDARPNGYLESIRKGSAGLSRFRGGVYYGSGDRTADITRLREEIQKADAVVIGAGAGLSTSAGFRYDGDRFNRYLGDFGSRYGFSDMYTGGFVVMQLKPADNWAYWSRNIYINRYMNPPKDTYKHVLETVKDKDYFVITTNVDHCFQRAGFDKTRLFYTQGDYGLWQCRSGRVKKTYNNEVPVKKMLLAQGFWFEHVMSQKGVIVEQDSEMIRMYGEYGAWHCNELDYEADWGDLLPPQDSYGSTDFSRLRMSIPEALIPRCPDNGEHMTMNLRADDTFVEDEGWHEASANYAHFLRKHESGHVLYLELGVGSNTPVIIKFPFWTMTYDNPDAIYACLNYNEAFAPAQISPQSICISGDTGDVMRAVTNPEH